MRLFVAIDIPHEVREELERLRARLMPFQSLQLVFPENIHLTLKYMGEVQEAKLEKVKRALASVAFSDFKLETTKLGMFPKVFWLGVKLTKDLAQLQQAVERSVREFTTHDPRSYKPHLTLARFSRLSPGERNGLQQLMKRIWIRKKWKVESFTLYKSEMTRDGPVYTAMARFPIK
jgi:2'-5' RNA ligase